MVFQKRLDCVSNGYQIPAMPTVPRSAKGKRSARKKIEGNQMCAIDLLATLAGKLLAEKEGFWTPSKTAGVTSTVCSNIQGQLENESPFKGRVFDQGSCDDSTIAFPFVPDGQIAHTSRQHLKSLEARIAAYAPALVKSDASENDASCKVFAIGARGEFPSKFACSTSPICIVDHGTVVPLQATRQASGSLIYDDTTRIRTLEDPIDLDRKFPVIVSSDSTVEVPSYGNCRKARSSSFPSIGEGMGLHGERDDGENSSGCTHPRYIHPKAFKAHCTEDHSRRKMMKSNYRKADPVSYNDGELFNDDVEMKPVFRSQRLFYTRQRTHRSSFKKRKLFDRCSVSPSCGSSRDEAILASPVKDVNRLEAASNLLAALNGANNMPCTTRGQNSLHESEDHPVKLSIKSFRVPELFIEIPADATVGSLKRTVMEAVMAIFGDGLRVGVLLQGKKVRDDNKTLRQAGISYEDKMDSLGFTLEPNPTGTPPPCHSLEEPAFLPSDPGPPNKFQAVAAHILEKGTSDATFRPPPIPIPTTNCTESDQENSVHSPIDRSSFADKIASDSKALVPMPAENFGVLSILPTRKSSRSDITQRRIRRPFSVSEVEALVQAVEKLGTGRWRDVKHRDFDNAKHRTYVDLKDKWKTLVHTARISPQQRRGEPVPQELLDRVLLAHAYWTQQQAKLPGPAESCLLL